MKKIASFKKQISIQSNSSFNKAFIKSVDKMLKKSKSSEDLNKPYIPFFCPLTKKIRDNEKIRDMLIYDGSNQIQPRLSWYSPNDEMIPSDWFEEGIKADLNYYFGNV